MMRNLLHYIITVSENAAVTFPKIGKKNNDLGNPIQLKTISQGPKR